MEFAELSYNEQRAVPYMPPVEAISKASGEWKQELLRNKQQKAATVSYLSNYASTDKDRPTVDAIAKGVDEKLDYYTSHGMMEHAGNALEDITTGIINNKDLKGVSKGLAIQTAHLEDLSKGAEEYRTSNGTKGYSDKEVAYVNKINKLANQKPVKWNEETGTYDNMYSVIDNPMGAIDIYNEISSEVDKLKSSDLATRSGNAWDITMVDPTTKAMITHKGVSEERIRQLVTENLLNNPRYTSRMARDAMIDFDNKHLTNIEWKDDEDGKVATKVYSDVTEEELLETGSVLKHTNSEGEESILIPIYATDKNGNYIIENGKLKLDIDKSTDKTNEGLLKGGEIDQEIARQLYINSSINDNIRNVFESVRSKAYTNTDYRTFVDQEAVARLRARIDATNIARKISAFPTVGALKDMWQGFTKLSSDIQSVNKELAELIDPETGEARDINDIGKINKLRATLNNYRSNLKYAKEEYLNSEACTDLFDKVLWDIDAIPLSHFVIPSVYNAANSISSRVLSNLDNIYTTAGSNFKSLLFDFATDNPELIRTAPKGVGALLQSGKLVDKFKKYLIDKSPSNLKPKILEEFDKVAFTEIGNLGTRINLLMTGFKNNTNKLVEEGNLPSAAYQNDGYIFTTTNKSGEVVPMEFEQKFVATILSDPSAFSVVNSREGYQSTNLQTMLTEICNEYNVATEDLGMSIAFNKGDASGLMSFTLNVNPQKTDNVINQVVDKITGNTRPGQHKFELQVSGENAQIIFDELYTDLSEVAIAGGAGASAAYDLMKSISVQRAILNPYNYGDNLNLPPDDNYISESTSMINIFNTVNCTYTEEGLQSKFPSGKRTSTYLYSPSLGKVKKLDFVYSSDRSNPTFTLYEHGKAEALVNANDMETLIDNWNQLQFKQ